MINDYNYGTGKRKTSIARVFLKEGTGKITVNKMPMEKYFGRETGRMIINQPFVAINRLNEFDVMSTVKGGGESGQTNAIRHGITKALIEYDSELKPILSSHGYTTRDSRKVERKKVGLHKARKRKQFSKR